MIKNIIEKLNKKQKENENLEKELMKAKLQNDMILEQLITRTISDVKIAKA